MKTRLFVWLAAGTSLALLGTAPPAAADPRCQAPPTKFDEVSGRGDQPIPVGEGFYLPEKVRDLARILVEHPASARRQLRDDFVYFERTRDGTPIRKDVGGVILLAQLAGWSVNAPDDPLPNQAYETARKILFDVYGEGDVRDRNTEYVQWRFVSQLASIYGTGSGDRDNFGRGTARMKADALAMLGERVAAAEKQKKKIVAVTTVEHLAIVLQSCEIERSIRALASTKSGMWAGYDLKLDRLLAAPLIYKPYGRGANAALAQALARVAIDVGRAAKAKGVNADAVKDQAYFLGKVLAATDVALWVHVRAANKPKASVEEGAEIVRFTLSAIEFLAGKTVKPVTGVVRKGVDWLESREKAAQLAAETKTYKDIRAKLVQAVMAGVESEIGLKTGAFSDADRMQSFMRTFEQNLLEGRRMAIEEYEKGSGITFEEWMKI